METQALPALPDASALRPIHPGIRKVWLASAVVGALFLAAVLAGFCFLMGPRLGLTRVAAALIGLGIGFLPLLRSVLLVDQQYKAWGYLLTDHELVARWGVFWRTARYVPRDAVQHVDINQGPIDRQLGLAQVVVFTAATGNAVVTIPGLPHAEAQELRNSLLPKPEEEAALTPPPPPLP
ncbi:MAG: PH domain-containing protein [Fimbriimonadaceae bacterium]|nr:PH domain-containing protein [Fimbriimonadaceae bacterium]QYK59108.1 MAG: PH domain-containing protein [Fimbriimonadaceae bacterium]